MDQWPDDTPQDALDKINQLTAELEESERILQSVGESCFKLGEKVKEQHARIVELESDSELGALIRKMPLWYRLCRYPNDGVEWVVENDNHEPLSGLKSSPEEALREALGE